METKDKLHKARDDTDELEKIREELNHQNTRVIEFRSKLNEKNKNIDALEKDIEDLQNKNTSLNKCKKEVENLEYQLKYKNASLNEYEQKI